MLRKWDGKVGWKSGMEKWDGKVGWKSMTEKYDGKKLLFLKGTSGSKGL